MKQYLTQGFVETLELPVKRAIQEISVVVIEIYVIHTPMGGKHNKTVILLTHTADVPSPTTHPKNSMSH